MNRFATSSRATIWKMFGCEAIRQSEMRWHCVAVSYFAAVYLGHNLKLKILVEWIFLASKRFFGVPSSFDYAMADEVYNLLLPDKTGLKTKRGDTQNFQLSFNFW